MPAFRSKLDSNDAPFQSTPAQMRAQVKRDEPVGEATFSVLRM